MKNRCLSGVQNRKLPSKVNNLMALFCVKAFVSFLQDTEVKPANDKGVKNHFHEDR